MAAAEVFGLDPARWRAQSVDDRARMLAYHWLKGRLEGYIHENWKGDDEPKKDGMVDAKAHLNVMRRQIGLRAPGPREPPAQGRTDGQ